MRIVPNFRYILLILLFVGPMLSSIAQEKEYLAIIPTVHDRLNTSGSESPLQLRSQRFVLSVYRNAVAVYSEAKFANMSMDTLVQELALPSTGHDENGSEPGGRISNGILSVQLWLEGEQVMPELIYDVLEDWYTIRARFSPGQQRKVKALFWAQTSLTDVDSVPGLDTVALGIGKRGFMVDLAHAAEWNNIVQSIDVAIVLEGGLSFQRDSFVVDPDTYELQNDTTLVWSIETVEPTASDNIYVSYAPSGKWGGGTGTMAKLSAYIVTKAYDNLLSYVREKDEE